MEAKTLTFEVEVRERLTRIEANMARAANKADIESLKATMWKAMGGLGIAMAVILVRLIWFS